jgi:GDP-L-fucose synthase
MMCGFFMRQYGYRFISACENLYGPNDNFDLNSSHVLPALIRKFHEAKADGAAGGVLGEPARRFAVSASGRHGGSLRVLLENYEGESHVKHRTRGGPIRALAELIGRSSGTRRNPGIRTGRTALRES